MDELSRRRRAEALRRRGLELASAGRLAEAEAVVRRALAADPRDRESRNALLFVRRALGQAPDLRLAERALRRALALSPRDREARRLLVDVLRRRARESFAARRFKEGEGFLRRALAASPRDPGLRRDLVEARLLRDQAKESETAGGSAAGLARAEKIRALEEALQSAGRIYDLEARTREVERVLAGILRLDPRNARARLLAGGVLRASGAVARGRRLLADALRLDRGTLGGGEAFSALMKLGRYKAAVARAERILDGEPDLADMRAFWDPWAWDARGSAEERRGELAKMARALGPDSGSPWLHFYRGISSGSDDLREFEGLARHPAKRYGWMFMKAGRTAFNVGRFDKGEEWLRRALEHESVDWRAHGYLAEGLLCLRRPEEALREMERALAAAPEREARDVLAWRGGLNLWLGRYETALAQLEEACRLDASFAYCWRGGALVKLGRHAEALERLDETVRRFPQDLESYTWRGEAKRELGLFRESLEDLGVKSYAGSPDGRSLCVWSLVNRALAKSALGDRDGFRKDFDAIPAFLVAHIRAETGHADPEKILRAGLDLSRGFRRDDYRQAIWMK